jgi:hypothetical protein
MTILKREMTAGWGVTPDEVLDRAVRNLMASPLKAETLDGLALIDGPDGYTSSWLAAPSALSLVAGTVGTEVLAIAPHRDELVLVDTADPDVTAAVLRQALDSYTSATRQLSPVPYLVGPGGVLEVWRPPADHPAAPVVAEAQVVFQTTEYALQRERLQDLFTRAGEDVFVSDHMTKAVGDGSWWSMAAWTRQVSNGLMPRTDYVVLFDNDDPDAQFAVRWDDVLRLAGPALEPTEMDPPLWRYQGWPDAGVVEALRALEVTPP